MNSEFTIAVHSLVFLAYRTDRMATSEMIAHNVGTHPSRVRKVLSCMRKHGLIATKEGIGGGFLLNCSPDEVTLADVYLATSIGSMKPNWCSGNTEEGCMVACNMADVMERIFIDAERQMLLYLQNTVIRDVLDSVQAAQGKKEAAAGLL
ncbi:Rrf2 family transcriptional regulator [Paenibacillus cymbidii]|uniref:Rrf2 family transcriptional regulator n=1 Tax=Paenibacillus cymbidii TaxID=1639034 RepID=UPI0010806394|nr:Rrf2 family transcriptional regulator [Paenibacillus cymbidii]